MVSANPEHEKEIRRRIGMGWSSFGEQNLVMNSNLPLSLKRKVYNQCTLLALTYGSGTWRPTKELERKVCLAMHRINCFLEINIGSEQPMLKLKSSFHKDAKH